MLNHLPSDRLGAIAVITDGMHGGYEIDPASGIHMLTAKNARPWFANLDDAVTISGHADDRGERLPESDDIILSIRGTVGNCALVGSDILPAVLNQDVADIRMESPAYAPEFLLAYLNSTLGLDWMMRHKTGMIQQGVSIAQLRTMMIPRLSPEFQNLIMETVRKAHACNLQAESDFRNAERLLACDNPVLGMGMGTGDDSGISILPFSGSFMKTGRLDAEYYQPKYELIGSSDDFVGTVGTLCDVHDDAYTPEKNREYRYIELADVGKSGEISNAETLRGSNLPGRARRLVKSGYVIIPSVEKSVGNCAIVTDAYDNAVCSTGFHIVSSKNYNSATLLMLFKSSLLQNLLHRGCSGTILTSITEEDLLNVPLPRVSSGTQKKIAQYVFDAYDLRAKSRNLLTSAVEAVEMAVRKNESKASDLLKAIH